MPAIDPNTGDPVDTNTVVLADRTHVGFSTWVNNDLKVEEFAVVVKDMATTLVENGTDPNALFQALIQAGQVG